MMQTNTNTKVLKSELISTFSNIDMKINNLHQRSASDFMELNNYLKDYHLKARIISENAFRIFKTILGEKDVNLIKELSKIFSRLEECSVKINDEDFRKIQLFKEIILKSNQLAVTLRNLRQDFTTFKFLSTNFCLITNYKELDIEWNKKLEVWNDEIQSIQRTLTFVGNHVDNFIEQTNGSIAQIEARVERSLSVYQNISRETKANIGSVVLKNQESKHQFPLLKEKTAESSRSINDIITHLQYQDIIRQKIEHIQKSHFNIIEDLSTPAGMVNADDECLAGDYTKISDIVDLQAAQLLLVSKEYQSALNVITRNFQSIANALSTISGISDNFSYKDSTSEITLLKQIKDQLDNGILLLDLNNFSEISSKYVAADRNLDLITNQLKHVIQPMLNELTELGNFEDKNFPRDTSGSGILLQIIALTRDIESKNQEICERINEIRTLSGGIVESTDFNTWGTQLELDHIQLMVNISRILESLDKNNEELDNVLMQNRDLNKNILEKIENVINKGDYYIFFESIVEEIIKQLTKINHRIRPAISDERHENKAANLSDIKKNYTMESERIIHDYVVSGSKEPENSERENPEDIEFF
jgi:hypothetical protein